MGTHGGNNWGYPGNANTKEKIRSSRRSARRRTGDGGRLVGKGWMAGGTGRLVFIF